MTFFNIILLINIIPRFCTLNSIVICEGTSSIITCPDKSLIQIQSAFYGRFNNKLCPTIATEMNLCKSANVTDFIQKLCYKNNSCFIVSNNNVFGYDPCRKTFKYTIVNYDCFLETDM
ncbi:L-rhamnose-binding lectin ELEL-1-like [Hydra vulgaris]|uniref:L-rhamnose-binding lectin ELEL-1-like n=1 Tax=Hydra vulgaris TaxID=6087 RepID=A0ABM4BUU5_HYDVU